LGLDDPYMDDYYGEADGFAPQGGYPMQGQPQGQPQGQTQLQPMIWGEGQSGFGAGAVASWDGRAVNSRSQPPASRPGLPPGHTALVMMQPQSFDEVPDAVTALRDRKSVILDLSLIDVEHAQRCADYVAGGAYAMDGHYQQLGDNVFLFTPASVQISHHVMGAEEEIADSHAPAKPVQPDVFGMTNLKSQKEEKPPQTPVKNQPTPLVQSHFPMIDPSAI
jgi:cell division inhibitor SepF